MQKQDTGSLTPAPSTTSDKQEQVMDNSTPASSITPSGQDSDNNSPTPAPSITPKAAEPAPVSDSDMPESPVPISETIEEDYNIG